MPRGRPTGSKRLGSQVERTTVQLRVPAFERREYEQRAADLGLTVSEWLRQLARRDCALWTEPLPRLRVELVDGVWTLDLAVTLEGVDAETDDVDVAACAAMRAGLEDAEVDLLRPGAPKHSIIIRREPPGGPRYPGAQAARDGGAGVIRVDGRRCYVQE